MFVEEEWTETGAKDTEEEKTSLQREDVRGKNRSTRPKKRHHLNSAQPNNLAIC